MTTSPSKTSARTTLRAFLVAAIEGKSEITTEELVVLALEHFQDDTEFMAAALQELVRILVPELVHKQMNARRGTFLAVTTGWISRASLDTEAKHHLSRVFENVNGEYKVFTRLKRPDVLTAAASREKRAAGELRWANFEREVAGEMKNDHQTVEEVFSDLQLSEIMKKHFPPANATPAS